MKFYKMVCLAALAACLSAVLPGCGKAAAPAAKYSGPEFEYESFYENPGCEADVSLYSYDGAVYLYISALSGSRSFITSEVLDEEQWDAAAEAVLSAAEVSSDEPVTARLKTGTGPYRSVEQISLDVLHIDELKIHAGKNYDNRSIEEAKELFAFTDIEEALGGTPYKEKGEDLVRYRIPDGVYAFVTEQIRDALGTDTFKVKDVQSDGYRNGMRLLVSSDGGDYLCDVTGHGAVAAVQKA